LLCKEPSSETSQGVARERKSIGNFGSKRCEREDGVMEGHYGPSLWPKVISSLNLPLLFLSAAFFKEAGGHGRLRHPTGRSTMWRYGFETPENVNDHELNCGGFGKQQKNNGLCGVCGDPFDQPRPRDNEMGGRYGLGIVVEEYVEGQMIDIEVELTAYHQGYFEFRLCPHNTRRRPAQQQSTSPTSRMPWVRCSLLVLLLAIFAARAPHGLWVPHPQL